jgi:hypothetical protein
MRPPHADDNFTHLQKKETMKKNLLTILLLLITGPLLEADKSTVKAGSEVLFLGNSFTENNDLVGLISVVAEANGISFKPQKALKGGQSIAGHSEDKKTLSKLSSQAWDGIVLQGHSLEPILKKGAMVEGAKKIASQVGDARVYVFVTWAYGSESRFLRKSAAHKKGGDANQYKEMYKNMQNLLNEGYLELSQAVDGEIVPVGSVWEATRKKYPDWNLFGKDMYHPSKMGSYLTALVFYTKLFGKVPPKTIPKWADQATHDKMTAMIKSIIPKVSN